MIYMANRTKLIFDVVPEEKEWLESILAPGQTKIALLRELLDEYAKKKKLPARPAIEKIK